VKRRLARVRPMALLSHGDIASVCGERPDHADRNDDEQDRPDWVIRQPGESRHQDDDAADQVDPGPGRDIELEVPSQRDCIELAVEETDQAGDHPPAAHQDHHDTGEGRIADRSATRLFFTHFDFSLLRNE